MIDPELVAKIRLLFFAEHWKIGTIATQMNLHRDTVRAALQTDRFSRPKQDRASRVPDGFALEDGSEAYRTKKALDAILKVGSTTETVEVKARCRLMEPEYECHITDTVQEFNVNTSMANTDLGGPAVLRSPVITNSGTNIDHGSGFYFGPNKALNARFGSCELMAY